jgi:hypothetical protein
MSSINCDICGDRSRFDINFVIKIKTIDIMKFSHKIIKDDVCTWPSLAPLANENLSIFSFKYEISSIIPP